MRHINHDLVNVCSKLKLLVCCFVWFCSTTSQSQHVVEESNDSIKDFEKSTISLKNANSRGNNIQPVSTNHQKTPDANQCAIKLDELNASVMRLKQRRLMLSEKGENSRNIIQAINFEITQKELEIAYWNSMLISIKAAEQQKVPKPIYDGTLAGDELSREALKATYYVSRPDKIVRWNFNRSDFDALPEAKQKIILGQPERYRIIENK